MAEKLSGKLSAGSVVLRVLAVVSFLASAIILYFISQKQELKKVPVVAEYQNVFQFSMVLYAIGFVYNLMVFFIPAGSPLWRTAALVDVIMNMLINAGLVCSWQTYSVMRKRDACRLLPFFCSKLLGSLITSSFGFLVSFVLQISVFYVSVFSMSV